MQIPQIPQAPKAPRIPSIPPLPPSGRQGSVLRRSTATRMMARPSTNPMMAPMYWACSDLMILAAQIGQGAVSMSVADLRRKLDELIADMTRRGQSAAITPEDLRDASYAIIALFDEILVKANWPGRQEWQASPMQFIQFRENTAGDNFFRRAEVLCDQPHRAHVLEVYFLCMALGFQGRYALSNSLAECDAFYQRIGGVLAGSTQPSEVLSPQGVPPDAGRTLL